MTINEGMFVDLSFKVFIFTEKLDVKVYTKTSFKYFHPSVHFFKKIQKSLLGAKVHERVIVTLEPHEAYGVYDDDLVYTVERDLKNEDFNPEIGYKYELDLNDGKSKYGKVISKDDKHIYLDTNHPLAGAKLLFDIFVNKISCTNNEASMHQTRLFDNDFNFK